MARAGVFMMPMMGEDHPDHSAGLRQTRRRMERMERFITAKTIPITQRD